MTTELGSMGEEIAREYYEKQGYDLVAQNYHSRFGEIDLIMGKDNLLILCEVKTRRSRGFYYPLEAVDKNKQRKLILTAQDYLIRNYSKHLICRFDVVEIIFHRPNKYEINCIEGAFEL